MVKSKREKEKGRERDSSVNMRAIDQYETGRGWANLCAACGTHGCHIGGRGCGTWCAAY